MVSGFSGYSNTKPDKAELSLEIKFDDTKGKTIQWRDEDRQTRWRQTNEMKTDKRDEDRQTVYKTIHRKLDCPILNPLKTRMTSCSSNG